MRHKKGDMISNTYNEFGQRLVTNQGMKDRMILKECGGFCVIKGALELIFQTILFILGWKIPGSALMVSGVRMDQRGDLIDRGARRIETPGGKRRGPRPDFWDSWKGTPPRIETSRNVVICKCLQILKGGFYVD